MAMTCRIHFRHTAVGQALRALAIVAIGVGLIYLVQVVELASVMVEVFSGINATTDSAKNHRDDEATASTESSGNWGDPDKTVVRLRRAHHWFWTTLVEAQSFGVREHLNWRNDDALDVALGFGCLTHVTDQVEKVGSIRIHYHLSDGDTALAKGCPN
jgi:hypothetical protein